MEPATHTTTLAEIVQVFEGLGVDREDVWFVINFFNRGYLSASRFCNRPFYFDVCESNFLTPSSSVLLEIAPYRLINEDNLDNGNPIPLLEEFNKKRVDGNKFWAPYVPPTSVLEKDRTIFHTPFTYTLPPFYSTLEEAVVGSLLLGG